MKSSCDYCLYYRYREEYECYECEINLDEDDQMRLLNDRSQSCPYFRFGDDYAIVKKQM